MGIIQTFKDIAKNETVRRSKLPGLVKDMRSDIVEHRRNNLQPDSPAVSADTSKSDFSRAYKSVQNMSAISFLYIAGMLFYIVSLALSNEASTGDLITATSLLFIGILWHVSFCLRALRARRVAEVWSERHEPFPMTYSEFFDESLGDPLVFLPFLKPLYFPSDKINKEK